MSLILGLDTGGTYTDAVIINKKSNKVISSSKSLTTYQNLVLGLNNSVSKVLDRLPKKDKNNIDLVVLSSTLATNAVVNGIGEIINLILIGYDKSILNNNEIIKVTDGNFVSLINGGHDAQGNELKKLDLRSLESIIKKNSDVTSYAVTSQFSVRNSIHEIEARKLIKKLTNLPVTCSHELSLNLNGPKRAVTCVLNAKIIGIIDNLIKNVELMLKENNISSQLMIVKGDGSLINTDVAKLKPVETIMSGPAAATLGASWLTNMKNAVVSDIGGTTTDISLINFGTPNLNHDGSVIGRWKTMVEALDIQTTGLGADSEVSINLNKNNDSVINIGPARAVPLSQLACDYSQVISTLKTQANSPLANYTFGKFVWLKSSIDKPSWLRPIESKIWDKLDDQFPIALSDLAPNQSILGATNRLIKYNLLGYSAFTPTDTNHILEKYSKLNTEAAILGAKILIKNKDLYGNFIAKDITELSNIVFQTMIANTSASIFEYVLNKEKEFSNVNSLDKNPVLKQVLIGKRGRISDISLKLNIPIIALGASAKTYYKLVKSKLSTNLIIPKNYAVAGAVGAAIGSIKQTIKILISSSERDIFIVHNFKIIKKFTSLSKAKRYSITNAKKIVIKRCMDAGAKKVKVTCKDLDKFVEMGNNEKLFIESVVIASGIGSV